MDDKQFKQFMRTQENIAKSLATIAGCLKNMDPARVRDGRLPDGSVLPPLGFGDREPERTEFDGQMALLAVEQAFGGPVTEVNPQADPLAKGIDGMG